MTFKTAALSFIVALVLLGGCGVDGPETPVENPRHALQPTDTRTEKYCRKDATGNFVGPADVVALKGKKESFYFAEGGGCLYHSIREVWAISHNSQAVKWRESDLDGVKRITDPAIPFAFEAEYSAGPAFLKQRWVMQWFQSIPAGAGPLEKPTSLLFNYQKVRGTVHIKIFRGSILLSELAPNITRFEMVNEIEGSQIDEEKAAGSIRDIYNNLQDLTPNWEHLP